MRSIISVSVFIVFIFSAISGRSEETQRTLQEFETDGCTMFIDGPNSNPTLWSHCCFEHDLRYWFGGTKEDKNFSDIQLRECVRNVAGSFWANLMYAGVRAGAFSPVKFKYVWSWGWTPKRTREPLTSEETSYVVEKIYSLGLTPEFTEMFIKKYLESIR